MGIVRPDNSKGNDNLLAAALDYAERFGWSIVPIAGDKRPPKGFRLLPRYRTVAGPDLLRGWFERYELSGIAIVCGMVSGGLIVRDFDDEAAYERWAQRFSELARSAPTVRTKRGYHVYCRCETMVRSRRLEDGELRVERHYVVCPPSRHPQGGVYHWIIKPIPGGLPVISDPAEVGLLGEDVTEPAEHTEPIEPAELTERTEAVGEGEKLSPEILAAIQATLPTGPGQRNKQLFELARQLKAFPELHAAPTAVLREIVRVWHRMALPKIQTESFDETRLDFHRAWGNVILPAGAGGLAVILEAADREGIPPEAEHYDKPNVRRLAGFCRKLQRLAGTGTFFLSCRKVGEMFGVRPTTANGWLRLLELDGLLVAVKRGSPQSMRATRFRYSAE